MTIMDGSLLSAKIKDELRCEIESFKKVPCLAVISIGDDEASKIYINNKKKSSLFEKITHIFQIMYS